MAQRIYTGPASRQPETISDRTCAAALPLLHLLPSRAHHRQLVPAGP